MPLPTTSQSTRTGQSRIQRPLSYHGKSSSRTEPLALKPPGLTSRDAAPSPTKLPVFSQNARSLLPKREALHSIDGPSIPFEASRSQVKPLVRAAPPALAHHEPSRDKVHAQLEDTSTKAMQSGKDVEKPATRIGSRQTSSTVSRTPSMRRPTLPSTTNKAAPDRTHARHASTTTLGSARTSRATSSETKPLRSGAGNTSTDNARRVPSDSIKRTASLRARAEPPTVNTTATSTSSHQKQPPNTAALPPSLRPAFSTLQQHYSPRKAPKATTTSITTPSTPSDPPSSLSTLAAQTHLLHLSIQHAALLTSTSALHTSARRALATKFEHLNIAHSTMRTAEHTLQEQLNLAALADWSSGGTSYGFVENVQVLSSVVREVGPLTEEGGRVEILTREFEEWITNVEGIWERRKQGAESSEDSSKGDGDEFIDSLGTQWAAEAASLTRRLTALSKDADMLVDAQEGSSVAAMVGGYKKLLRGTLEELVTMAKVEKEVMAGERVWVQERLDGVDWDTAI